MLITINKPRLTCSNIPAQNGNDLTIEHHFDNLSYSTEVWSNDPEREWIDADVCTAKRGYTWITRWEAGKNYIITKIVDNHTNLVGYYCDITSTVNRVGNHWKTFDWYLDIFMLSNSKIIILDKDEFEEAVRLGYLSPVQAVIAKNASDEVWNTFNSGLFQF